MLVKIADELVDLDNVVAFWYEKDQVRLLFKGIGKSLFLEFKSRTESELAMEMMASRIDHHKFGDLIIRKGCLNNVYPKDDKLMFNITVDSGDYTLQLSNTNDVNDVIQPEHQIKDLDVMLKATHDKLTEFIRIQVKENQDASTQSDS